MNIQRQGMIKRFNGDAKNRRKSRVKLPNLLRDASPRSKVIILMSFVIYIGMMMLTFHAHGHVSVPIPTMQDLIPMILSKESYQEDYDLFHGKYNLGEESQEWEISHFPLMGTYGQDIQKCSTTVVFVDAKLPNLRRGAPSMFALESIAAFMPKACIVIQTSKCNFNSAIQQPIPMSLERSIYLRLFDAVEELTHDMMENGRVRVSFLDNEKYQLDACDDFSNFSHGALMNLNYWTDEFLPEDSDTVMILQEGSLMCHSFDVERFRRFDYVSAPLSENNPIFNGSNACISLEEKWKSYTSKGNEHPMQINPDFAALCSSGFAPLAVDGFALGSRKAMRTAIHTCPHKQWSGIKDLSDQERSCVATDENDPLYFSTVLAAIGAKLPSGLEASFFSLKELWPDDALNMWGGPFFRFERQVIASESYCIFEGASVGEAKRKRTVPIGVDNAWLHISREDLLSKDVDEQCPLVKYVI